MKAIRLLTQIRVGNALVPPNAVVDAEDAVADHLTGEGMAEETDAVERYPNTPRVMSLDDVEVTGSEKFPLPADDERRVEL